MPRLVDISKLHEQVRDALWSINTRTTALTMDGLRGAESAETAPAAKRVLCDIIANRELASHENIPMCQDTGMAVLFVRLGQEVQLINGQLNDRINEGVRLAYTAMRKSVIREPLFDRANTMDNTPAIIHTEIVEGDTFEITIAAKGFGAENMSRARLLPPSAGIEGVKREVIQVVDDAGPNACPPIVVGVGLGGTLEVCALLAKKALLREPGQRNSDPRYAMLELQILDLVNQTGIGAQGLGGIVTALDVRIEFSPTHIASLPIAVNLDCHLQRHTKVIL